MTDVSIWEQYANIFIPLGVSAIALFGSLFIYKEKVSNIEKNLDSLVKEVREMRDKIIACETSLREREREVYVQRKSPLSLTESGKILLKNSGGEKFIIDNFDFLLQKVEEQNPKTAYDIQELSGQILEGQKSDDKFNTLKDYAFKEGLPLEDIIQVMGIELRDKILQHKGWEVSDIDKHDPSLQGKH